jgi:hypothetical protein
MATSTPLDAETLESLADFSSCRQDTITPISRFSPITALFGAFETMSGATSLET